MKSKSYLLIVGDCPIQAVPILESAAEMAGMEVEQAESVEAATARVAEARPGVVLFDLDAGNAPAQATTLRMALSPTTPPIIGFSEEPTDLSFEEAFRAGIDDVSRLDERSLARRIRQVADVDPPAERPRERTAIVADDGSESRLIIGRVFRDAGYRVEHVDDAEAIATAAARPEARIVVASSTLAEPEALAELAREDLAIIVNTPPKDIVSMREKLDGRSGIVVHDAFASPETLLFVANEILNRPAVEARASARLLYGALVYFRRAGRDDVEIGHLYNISGGGMYVRTLAVVDDWEELWLEFTPPRSDRRVHLEGTAVWTRRYGAGTNATVPCGFGVQITGGSQRDLTRYGASYERYLAERDPESAHTARRQATTEPVSATV